MSSNDIPPWVVEPQWLPAWYGPISWCQHVVKGVVVRHLWSTRSRPKTALFFSGSLAPGGDDKMLRRAWVFGMVCRDALVMSKG